MGKMGFLQRIEKTIRNFAKDFVLFEIKVLRTPVSKDLGKVYYFNRCFDKRSNLIFEAVWADASFF